VVGGHVVNSSGPAGLKISWPAIGILVSMFGLLGGIVGGIRKDDLNDIDESISAVRAAQVSDVSRLERRLERIEDKIDGLPKVFIPRQPEDLRRP
jgi:hypothetical protein